MHIHIPFGCVCVEGGDVREGGKLAALLLGNVAPADSFNYEFET